MFETELFPPDSNRAATDAAASMPSSEVSIAVRSRQKHRATIIAVIIGLFVLLAILVGPIVAARLNAPAVLSTPARGNPHDIQPTTDRRGADAVEIAR